MTMTQHDAKQIEGKANGMNNKYKEKQMRVYNADTK